MIERAELTNIEIRNLMLETLAYKNDDIDVQGNTFYKHNYQGSVDNLYNLMERLAIKKGLLVEKIKVPKLAWGSSSVLLHANSTTNFNENEINKIYESFYLLLNRGIIAPGATGNYGSSLPYFHVTEYGKRCLDEREVLPYDSDGYLNKLDNIQELDEWIEFYVRQGLECFNANCYEASLIMIGLANERIIEILLDNYEKYLSAINSSELVNFKKNNTVKQVSKKYRNYQKSLARQKNYDSDLNNMSSRLDKLASDTFSSYVRLTRNDLSHPNEIVTDRITTLMIFISFVGYCERQYQFIKYYKSKITT